MKDRRRHLQPSGELSTRTHKSLWLVIAVVFAVSIIVVLQVLIVGDWRVDDAYITFSYSKNLSTGRGPIFGYDLRVEGYSNFLWMVFIAAPLVVWPHADPLWIARAGTFSFLVLLGFVAWTLLRRRTPFWLSAILLIVLASWTDLTRAALSGMETIPYAALLGLSVLLYTHQDWKIRRWTWTVALCLGLMRINGFIPIGILIGWDLVLCPKRRRLITKQGLWWFAAPVVLYIGYFALRWAYYGLPLPLSYYAKNMVTVGDSLRGYRYLWYNVRALGLPAAVPFALIAVVRKPREDAFLLWFFIVVQCVYMVAVGGDWMPFARFLIPVVPLFLVLLAWGGESLLDFVRKKRTLFFLSVGGNRGWVVSAYLLLLAMILFLEIHFDAHIIATPLEAMKIYYAELEKKHACNDLYANRNMFQHILRRPGQKLVTDYGGMFSYYTNASIIEMWGLCNREIALHGNVDGVNPIFGKTYIAYYPEFDPDYFHVVTPLARPLDSFTSHQAVIDNVFQGQAIDSVLDLRRNYVTGRVIDENRNRALFFLERIRPDASFEMRRPAAGFRVDYPFLDKK